MQKPKLGTVELVFILISASILFTITAYQMSAAGILPGNDPSVHLTKSKQIIIDEKISYSEIGWYPPFFHTILAIIQIFAGTTDAIAAAFLLKMLMGIVNVLLMLSTYLLTRKLFGIGTAVISSLFTTISVPLFEMIFWGGYANFMGLAYIAFIFFIMNKDLRNNVKTLLLFSGTFTLILIHQLTAFVFVLMFIPVFLISSIGSKRRFITFLAVIIGGGLALLAWYARIIIDYADIIIEYIFYTVGENFYHIPSVSFDSLYKILGSTLFIMLLGIPIMLLQKKKTTSKRDLLLIIFWLAIPFILAESYFFGINLPYHRFVYFFATPITILCGVATYFSISKIPKFIYSKLFLKFKAKLNLCHLLKILVLSIVCSLFILHTITFVERVKTYPNFYERATMSSYESGLWVNQYSDSDGIVITPRSPGSWFTIFSNHRTIQETDPLSSRSVIAESVLYSFFEIENGKTLIREYFPASPSAGLEIDVLRFNLWTKVLNIFNKDINFIYVDPLGEWIYIPLSDTEIKINWNYISSETIKLVTEYEHDLFTLNKTITICSNSSLFNIDWQIQTNKEIKSAKLEVPILLDLSLDFKDAFIPGFLEWQNPWDNATAVDKEKEWAVVDGLNILNEKIAAILDSTNGILTVLEFDEVPNWSILGALEDRRIDALRVRYELGDVDKWNGVDVNFSIFTKIFDIEEIKQWNRLELEQLLNSSMNSVLIATDFFTLIEEYNIEFVAIDTKQIISNIEATPALDKIYDNGRSVLYTTKK